MQRLVFNCPFDTFEIIAASCEHQGSIMCHEAGLKKTVAYIAEKPNRFLIKLGDNIEAIATSDKKYNQPPVGMKEREVAVPGDQVKLVKKRYQPIADRIIAILGGNHERWLRTITHITEDICNALGIPDAYGTESCRIIVKHKGKRLFNIQAMHGAKLFKSNAKDPEQRDANKKAALKLYLKNQMGDCAIHICGHAHQILIVPPSKTLYFVDGKVGVQQNYLTGTPGSGYINPDQRWYACCGSARKSRLDGYDDYAQNYEPTELGFVKIIVKDGQIVKLEPFYI
jgi:hypothetical protein